MVVMSRELRVLVEWESILHRILDATQNFPKAVRFSFVQRIDNLTLDITQTFVLAQYAKTSAQPEHLHALNVQLAKLRLLLRISCDRKYLSVGLLADVIDAIEGIGFQLHSWLKIVHR
jgi:hypothetical protein